MMVLFDLMISSEISNFEIGFSTVKYKFDAISTDKNIINLFNKNEIFKNEDYHKLIRSDYENRNKYLEPAINFKNIVFEDYKIYTKQEILSFVWDNFSPFTDREIEKEKILFKQFKILLDANPTEKYYLLSMKFFDLSYDKNLNMLSDKITGYGAISYDVFFLVKWFEEGNILNVALFSYD